MSISPSNEEKKRVLQERREIKLQAVLKLEEQITLTIGANEKVLREKEAEGLWKEIEELDKKIKTLDAATKNYREQDLFLASPKGEGNGNDENSHSKVKPQKSEYQEQGPDTDIPSFTVLDVAKVLATKGKFPFFRSINITGRIPLHQSKFKKINQPVFFKDLEQSEEGGMTIVPLLPNRALTIQVYSAAPKPHNVKIQLDTSGEITVQPWINKEVVRTRTSHYVDGWPRANHFWAIERLDLSQEFQLNDNTGLFNRDVIKAAWWIQHIADKQTPNTFLLLLGEYTGI